MGWKQVAKTGGGGDFEKCPPGNHPAVLVALIDLGVQENEFNGEKKYQPRAYFCWELTGEKNSKGFNHLIGIDLTVSMDAKAKLRGWVDAWRGRATTDGEEFDISTLVGKKCLLSVTEKKGYSNVSGVAAIPKGMTVAPPTKTLTTFSIDDIKPDGTFTIPDWLPYLYGEPLTEVIKRRCEKEDEPEKGDANEDGIKSDSEQLQEMF